MELQIKACDYMEKTYGKKWTERGIVEAPITNAYIQGYMDKEKEDKTASGLLVSHSTYQEIEEILIEKAEKLVDNDMPGMGKFFGITITKCDKMPDHLAALVDGDGNVLSIIEIKKKK
jgi:hypothetical protein